MISTRDLSRLPDIDGLRRTLQAMAVLDAILSPEWDSRYYSFTAGWSADAQLGSMRNGEGDELFAHFGPAGCWLKGFVHNATISPYYEDPPRVWPGILDHVPAAFAGCLREPAFGIESVTFCVWRRPTDRRWRTGPVTFPPGHPDPDGSAALLSPLNGWPKWYRNWAEDYYERPVPLAAVRHVYGHRPLTPAVIARLNPDVSPEDLAADLAEIGYPDPPAK